jgi:hypothetical protein
LNGLIREDKEDFRGNEIHIIQIFPFSHPPLHVGEGERGGEAAPLIYTTFLIPSLVSVINYSYFCFALIFNQNKYLIR